MNDSKSVLSGATPSGHEREPTIERFSFGSRLAHWVLAVPFLFLLMTGLALYVPDLKALHVGGFRVFALAHVSAGILTLAAPIALWFGLRVSRGFRSDLGETVRFESSDTKWLEYAIGKITASRRREPPVGKFNAGQKLNTIFSLAVTTGLLATGAVLAINYFARGTIPAPFVEQVYPWHTRLMILSLPILAGHIYLALVNPSTRHSIHGIIGGRVNLDWAVRHHPRWVEDPKRDSAST